MEKVKVRSLKLQIYNNKKIIITMDKIRREDIDGGVGRPHQI